MENMNIIVKPIIDEIYTITTANAEYNKYKCIPFITINQVIYVHRNFLYSLIKGYNKYLNINVCNGVNFTCVNKLFQKYTKYGYFFKTKNKEGYIKLTDVEKVLKTKIKSTIITDTKKYIKNNIDDVLLYIAVCNSYVKDNSFNYVSNSDFYRVKSLIFKYLINKNYIHTNVSLEIDDNNDVYYSIEFDTTHKKYSFHQLYVKDNIKVYDKYIDRNMFIINNYNKNLNNKFWMEYSNDDINSMVNTLMLLGLMIKYQKLQ